MSVDNQFEDVVESFSALMSKLMTLCDAVSSSCPDNSDCVDVTNGR